MKLQILCDLHLEFGSFELPNTNADLIVFAGDIQIGLNGILWAQENIKHKPVIYIFGNHEYYNHAYPKLLAEAKAITENSNIHVLENNVFECDGYNILGCTLWTDFKLFNDFELSAVSAKNIINDYRKIRVSPRYYKFSPAYSSHIFNESLNWLDKEIKNKKSNSTIIVTHHAPSVLSISKEFRNDPLSAAFSSNLDEFVKHSGCSLWIHGHIHRSADYYIGDTRIICNPCGYPDEFNTGFNANLVIDI